MQVSTSRFNRAAIAPQTTPKADESFTFHNEPHVPMDSVMRGFNDSSFDGFRNVALNAFSGAVTGAISGSVGGGGIASHILVNAGMETAGSLVNVAVNRPEGGGQQILAAPIVGAQIGLVTGATSFLLSAVAGLPPVVSGAIAGGLTEAALSLT